MVKPIRRHNHSVHPFDKGVGMNRQQQHDAIKMFTPPPFTITKPLITQEAPPMPKAKDIAVVKDLPTTDQVESIGGYVGLRAVLRSLWVDRLKNEHRVSAPDLAREAYEHFATMPVFLARFWDEFGYEVMYDSLVNHLSSRRVFHDGDGDLVEGLDDWFERADHGHVTLNDATDEEWDAMFLRREEQVKLAQARIAALRALRDGKLVVGVRGSVYHEREHDVPPPPIEIVYDDGKSAHDFVPIETTLDEPPPVLTSPDMFVPGIDFPAVCEQCGDALTVDDAPYYGCATCVKAYGHHLLKAQTDPLTYAMRLTSGDLLYFESVSITGDWVYLHGVQRTVLEMSGHPIPPTPNPPFERGLQVNVDNIAWVADAPYGS